MLVIISQGTQTLNMYYQDTSAYGIINIFWARTETNRLENASLSFYS